MTLHLQFETRILEVVSLERRRYLTQIYQAHGSSIYNLEVQVDLFLGLTDSILWVNPPKYGAPFGF